MLFVLSMHSGILEAIGCLILLLMLFLLAIYKIKWLREARDIALLSFLESGLENLICFGIIVLLVVIAADVYLLDMLFMFLLLIIVAIPLSVGQIGALKGKNIYLTITSSSALIMLVLVVFYIKVALKKSCFPNFLLTISPRTAIL